MVTIVKKNLERMLADGRTDKGSMFYLLNSESIGGNAGNRNGRPCSAANFYYDAENGRIIIFTNYWEDVPANIRNRCQRGTFVLTFPESEIIEINLLKCSPPNAVQVIEETVMHYNTLKGFKKEKISTIFSDY